MRTKEKDSTPLLDKGLAHRKALQPTADPPATINIGVGNFHLPDGARTELTKAHEETNTYRLDAVIAGKDFGKRALHDTVPVELLKKRSITGEMRETSLDGLRHPWVEVKFVPPLVKLRANERPRPPIDFKLPKGYDLPCNVFAPDGRYIYQDTSFPWCTVGRVDSPLGTGTGCTIGSRLLLTCSHVIQWNSDSTAELKTEPWWRSAGQNCSGAA